MLDISELLKIAEMSGVGISHGDSGKHYILSENGEKEMLEMTKTRAFLMRQLQELQANFEDLSDNDILDVRECMLERVNSCLEALNECDRDNLTSDDVCFYSEEDIAKISEVVTILNLNVSFPPNYDLYMVYDVAKKIYADWKDGSSAQNEEEEAYISAYASRVSKEVNSQFK